jgi:hypothetical protein
VAGLRAAIRRTGGAAVVAALVACSTGDSSGLSPQVRRERLALIRDSAAQMGLFHGALLGGIAESETHLAHCWAEATYACRGPDAPACGGPIIAGSADGPCASKQGGLGMFQFDAGTWADTLARYGDAILTVDGNTAQAVSFVVDKVEQDVAGVAGWLAAVDWMNRVPLVVGDPVTEQWARLLACRYNGCCAASDRCTARANGYRDHAIALSREPGAAFWRTADRCAALPADGVIDDRTACYLAAGDPSGWHREPGGHGDGHDWTWTRAARAPGRFARWRIETGRVGRYRVEVFAEGGAALAVYRIAHAGAIDDVAVDQAATAGWATLGDFELTGDGDEHVELGDASARAADKLVFDAVRVTALGSLRSR